MKVVLFCGGRGLRLREYSQAVPKPMVPVGYRPVLWHIMKYYAHFGHNDFVLCLGHQADVVKRYFLEYDETVTNDFVLNPASPDLPGRRGDDRPNRRRLELVTDDIRDWRITFVDTGLHANIGERLAAVKPYLEGEETFLANYADGLSDLPLPEMLAHADEAHADHGALASFMQVRPSQSFHCIDSDDTGRVRSLKTVTDCDIWINGGFFVLRRGVFDYMHPGDELVGPTFDRLIEAGKLTSYRYDGFFGAMDTFKEQQELTKMHADGKAPWEVWRDEKRRTRDAVAAVMHNAEQPPEGLPLGMPADERLVRKPRLVATS